MYIYRKNIPLLTNDIISRFFAIFVQPLPDTGLTQIDFDMIQSYLNHQKGYYLQMRYCSLRILTPQFIYLS